VSPCDLETDLCPRTVLLKDVTEGVPFASGGSTCCTVGGLMLYNPYIDRVLPDLRVAYLELIYLAKLK
jgi:hypothetical protein